MGPSTVGHRRMEEVVVYEVTPINFGTREVTTWAIPSLYRVKFFCGDQNELAI